MNKTVIALLMLALTAPALADQDDTTISFVIKTDTGIMLLLNGTRNNRTYANNTAANMTAILDVSGTVFLYTNITGWGGPDTGASPLENTTMLSSGSNQTYNITAYFPANATHYSSTETWFIFLDVSANHAPSLPPLWMPLNSTSLSQTPIALHWNASTDMDLDSLTYFLQVDNDSDFSSPAISRSGLSWTWNATTALSDGAWWWRVIAYDGTVNSTSEQYWFNQTSVLGGGSCSCQASGTDLPFYRKPFMTIRYVYR